MPLSNSVSEALSELSGTVSTASSLDTNLVDSLQGQQHLYDGFDRIQQLDLNFVNVLREQMT
ncbi:MAG: hypothetical protein LBU27_01230 [Candidatus Peribacteria bacterium]|nr:hypothetical protein [Candidatus Peribacteria bacterium]